MGRHARPDTGAPAVPGRPDAQLVESLPGWGLFATIVAAASVRWSAPGWSSVLWVVALGLGSTCVLWSAVRRGERTRRHSLHEQRVTGTKVTMTSRYATLTLATPEPQTATRRVTP